MIGQLFLVEEKKMLARRYLFDLPEKHEMQIKHTMTGYFTRKKIGKSTRY